MIWIAGIAALCLLCAGVIALANTGGKGGGLKLTELDARAVAGGGSGVAVSGSVRGADHVFARYRDGCRVLRISASGRADGTRFHLRIPVQGSTQRRRQCNLAIAHRLRGTAVHHPPKARRGPIRVIACSGVHCVEKQVALRRPGGPAEVGAVDPGHVEVAPGVKVRVPTAPPVSPDVPASRFVSPNGSDSAPCTATEPCLTLNRAYRVAQPGQVVDVSGGSYPTQRIEYDPSKVSAADVYFRPAAGQFVRIDGDIDVYASHVTVMAMQAVDTDVPYDGPADVSDVTFWGMDGRNFTIDSGKEVNMIGGDYGPASSCGGSYGGGNNGIRMNRPGVVPSDILIWGVDMHDVQSYDLVACHIECLIVGAGERITVRGSRFWNCSIFDIFLQPFNGPISDVTLENNWFAAPTDPNGHVNSGRAVEFSGGGPWRNLLIRQNSVNTAINLNDEAPNPQYVNSRMIGNIAVRSNCYNGVTYQDNVWFEGSGKCDPSDRVLAGGPPFVNASDHADLDYHLTGGVAVDLVPSSIDDLAEDIDGQPRPDGAALDAGSDER
jgi:hypothetical protein